MTRTAAALTAALIALVLAAWVSWSPLDANDVGGDEGYYGVMARNILANPSRYLVSPSLTPGGPPGDKPPLYPSILAMSLRLFGVNDVALRAPSILFAALTALSVALLLGRLCDPITGVIGALLLLTLPAFADGSRVAVADVPLAALGTLALALSLGRPLTLRLAFLVGALLGLAFLCRTWLVAYYVLPFLAWPWPARPRNAALLALVASAVAIGASQLVLVWALRPQDLPHWNSMYWWGSLASRFQAEEYQPSWIRSPGFYVFQLLRSFGLLLPLVGTGVFVCLARHRDPAHRALLAWLGGVLLISVFSFKSGAYLYGLLPAWVVMAGLGAHALWTRGREAPVLGGFLLLALGIPAWALAAGEAALPVPVWLGVTGLFTALVVALRAWPQAAPALVVAAIVAAAGLGLVRVRQRLIPRYHDVGYRAIASAVGPQLTTMGGAPTFVSVEAPTLMYYLYAPGAYWYSPALSWNESDRHAMERTGLPALFVVDPRGELHGGSPDSSTRRWLAARYDDIGTHLETRAGDPVRLQVYVPRRSLAP